MKYTNRNSRRLPGLHGLRALAATAIVIFHTFGINKLQVPNGIQWMMNYLGLGVPLFFVISAFSLFFSTTPRIGNDSWVRDYLVRRFFRIAPLFYFSILFYCIFIPSKFGTSLSFSDVALSASFLFNLVPGKHESVVWAGWTIGVEMLFYLTVPILLVVVRNFFQAVIFVVISLVVSRVMYGYYQTTGFPENYAYLSLMGSFAVFAWGIAAYFLFECVFSNGAESRRFSAWAIAFLSVPILVAIVVSEDKLIPLVGNRSSIWGGLFAMLVVATSVHPFRFISSRLMTWMGERSFGLYLCHPPIVASLSTVHAAIYGICKGGYIAAFMCVLATLVSTALSAELVYRFIERPGTRYGERLIVWLSQKNLKLL